MTWQEAMERRILETKHEHYRVLCSNGHPHHKVWRQRMIEWAEGNSPTAVLQSDPNPTLPALPIPSNRTRGCGCGSPSAAQQVATAAAAAGRWVANGFRIARQDTQESRRTVCNGCDRREQQYDRCKECGCFISLKIRLPKERCPLSKWLEEEPESDLKPNGV